MGKHVALTTDRTIIDWLTPERRRAIYSAAAAILAALAALGVITGEQATAWGQVAEQLLAAAALVVAALHTGGIYEAPVIGTPVDDDDGTPVADAGGGSND
ncbi:phage holin [Actinomyces succiniciruminis]|uniref:Holin n=1 Tax=Actinomyces succiniciruminis TaxID=1522002 RepID=A0A1L7RNE7_9ACTO|nr:hypothetical protein [Actinomyces succiniciruminis]CED90633.1 Hypothetical protein AAM4_0801 [Actinomyces succiniciruminis]